MRNLVKLTGVISLGLSVLVAPAPHAQTANTLPPLPGPFQMMVMPQAPLQMQQRQRNQQRNQQSNWANNAQALPYWMQNPAAPNRADNNAAPSTTANPSQAGNANANAQANQNQTVTGQTGARWFGQATTSASNMMGARNTTAPGYFPGYVPAPTGQNNLQNNGQPNGQYYGGGNRNTQPANAPQFRPQNNNGWGGNMPNFGPSYGQMMPNWGGFNPGYVPQFGPQFGPQNGPQYGQQYTPPNGYGYPPGYGPYGPAPRR